MSTDASQLSKIPHPYNGQTTTRSIVATIERGEGRKHGHYGGHYTVTVQRKI